MNLKLPRIDARVRVCAIFGHPVGHSLSPVLHNAGFEALDLPFVYVAHDIAPGSLSDAIRAARTLAYRGLSITIPHKMAAMSCVDQIDETARAIGCINTIVNDNSHLKATNSDGLGALRALETAEVSPKGLNVVVLGSGGAARAIVMTLAMHAPPARLAVIGVDVSERAKLVADASDKSNVVESDLSSLATELSSADLLLHTTPVGMHPKEDNTLVLPELLHPGLTVFDAVYNPRRTRLLRDAAQRGCRVIEGLEMFLGQASVQFELWTGVPAPTQVFRAVVEASL